MQNTLAIEIPLHTGMELILGGQKCGKSRRAEMLAAQWLQAPEHQALLLATAWQCTHDAQMQARIARHRTDRALRVPRMQTLEVPLDLASTIHTHSQPGKLLVIDCMTLWLTNLLFPAPNLTPAQDPQKSIGDFHAAIAQAPGPVVIISNEIGLGVIPLGTEVRDFVDALGLLNQALARQSARTVFMAAGLPLVLKDNS